MKNILALFLALFVGTASAQTIGPPGGGGGGTPAGNPGDLQYNNTGAFGGFSMAGDCTILIPQITCISSAGTLFQSGAFTTVGTTAVVNGTTAINTFLATPSSANLGAALSDKTGSGLNVFQTSPTLITPVLGVASATTINKVTITTPATGATLTIPDGLTLNAGPGGTLGTAAFQNTGTSGATIPFLNGVNTYSGAETMSGASAASVSAALWSGTIFTGGTGTTTFPHMMIAPSSPTAVTTWPTTGTLIGLNAPTGVVTGLDLRSNGGTTLVTLQTSNSGTVQVGGGSTVMSGGSGFNTNANITTSTTAGGVGCTAASTGCSLFLRNTNTLLTSPASAQLQLGNADAASPIAQMLRAQSVLAGNANTAAVNTTFQGSLSNGTGGSTGNGGDLIFSTTASVAGSGVQNSAVIALRILSGTQEVRLPAITSDAGLTDSSVCQDTTNHGLRAGSGTLGACLGTSSARYKANIADIDPGQLSIVLALLPKKFNLKDGNGVDPQKQYYGFMAEDCINTVPTLTGLDDQGQPNTCDYLGLVPVLVKAVQELASRVGVTK